MKLRTGMGVVAVCVAAVVCALILGGAYKYKYKSQDVITVTGLGEVEFVSDLIVLQAGFSQTSTNLQEAYKALDADRAAIQQYLVNKGVEESEIVFSFVNVWKQNEPVYSGGDYVGTRFSGYQLNQNFRIESADVEKIERLSREVSELIAQGIAIESQEPEYYYSKLSDLKIDLINRATEDARTRAEAIAEKSGTRLGGLKSGRMGVIQITAPNTNEAYSWGGAYNANSKNKKASITMKLEYHLK